MYYIVEINLIGAYKALSFSDPSSQRILTSIFRLNKHQKSRLQYIKVKLYRRLEELASFSIDDKYVLNAKRLPEFESIFSEIYREFESLREEIFEELRREWPSARQAIENQLRMMGRENKLRLLDELDPPRGSKRPGRAPLQAHPAKHAPQRLGADRRRAGEEEDGGGGQEDQG